MIIIITYNKVDNNFNLLTLKSGHENHFVSEICGVVYLKRNEACVMRVMVIGCGGGEGRFKLILTQFNLAPGLSNAILLYFRNMIFCCVKVICKFREMKSLFLSLYMSYACAQIYKV